MKQPLFLAFLLVPMTLSAAPAPQSPQGCLIEIVKPGTAAEAAGLKAGDRIIEADGKALQSVDDLQSAVRRAGAELRLGVQRGETTESVTAKIPPALRPRLGVQCRESGGATKRIGLGDQRSLSLYGGAALPQTTLDAAALGAGNERVGSAGYLAGARFLNDISPRMDIGADLSYTDLGDHSFNVSGAINGPTDLTMQSSVLMAVIKFHPPRPARVLPYALLGVGAHHSRLRWEYHPPPLSYSPSASSILVDDEQVSWAMAAAGGVDLDISDRYFAGFEGRIQYLGSATYSAGPLGNAVGFDHFSGAQINLNIFLHLGMKFGTLPQAPLPLP